MQTIYFLSKVHIKTIEIIYVKNMTYLCCFNGYFQWKIRVSLHTPSVQQYWNAFICLANPILYSAGKLNDFEVRCVCCAGADMFSHEIQKLIEVKLGLIIQNGFYYRQNAEAVKKNRKETKQNHEKSVLHSKIRFGK